MAVPSVTTPQAADQIFDSTPQIQWTEIAGADSYEIWVSQIGNNQGAVYIQPGIAHNRVTLPFHLNDQLHRVWVRAFDANGQSSAWSSPLDFSVVYDKPSFLSASNITQTSASLSWNGVTGADSYEVWLAQNSGRVQLLSNLTSTTTQVTGLSTAATHTFWVRAMNDGHETSSWSPGKTFVTGGTPFATERPTGSNPGTVKNTTSAQLSWNHIPGADHYEVWLNRSDGTNIFIDNQVNSTVYWADQLQPGTSYRYWVRAVDEGGYHSRWSYAQNFSIAASNNELSNTTHVSSGSYYLGTAYSSSPNLVIDANSSVTLQSHNFDPTFDTIVIRAGATVTGQPLVSGDTFTLKANTLILEAGATLTGDFLTLQTTETFIGANATITAPGMYVRGRYVLGDSGNMYATAFASGSAFDPIITNGGVSFADQETTSDADFDDLSDIQEIVAGTLGGSADTDGDWLLDGFEVHNGLDPKTPLGNPSSPSFQWPDDDNDGLHLLDEQIYGTNPNLWDTDGDDRSDFDETNNGSNPNDHTDQGVAPAEEDLVEISLTVGDHSGSHSERYMLTVGDIRHQSEGFGVVSTRSYKFQRGTEHQVRTVHVATNQNSPDYDYTAAIGIPSKSGAYVIDPDQLLGVYNTSDPVFRAQRLTAILVISDNKPPTIDMDPQQDGIQSSHSLTIPPDLSSTSFSKVDGADPDGDQLYFRIADGNPQNYFEIISNSGELTLGPNLKLDDIPVGTYSLQVEVRDRSDPNAPGVLTDMGVLDVTVTRTWVGVTGDTQGIESTSSTGYPRDAIALRFFRQGGDLSDEFDVSYTIHWEDRSNNNHLSAADFENGAAISTGRVYFEAGSQFATVDAKPPGYSAPNNEMWLVPVSTDSVGEGLEGAWIEVHDTEDYAPGPIYDTPDKQYFLTKNRILFPSLDLQVLDGVKLFVDGIPLNSDDGKLNLQDQGGVHVDDVKQGAFADCWMMATLAAVAHSAPGTYSNLISAVTLTSSNPLDFDVTWADGSGTQRVNLNFGRGASAAQLSGDYDAVGVEAWVSIMETAFFQELGVGVCAFGDQSTILTALKKTTGGGSWFSFASQANAFAEGTLRDNGNKAIVLASSETPMDVKGEHAYAFIKIAEENGIDTVLLYDPKGELVTLPLARMVQNFQGAFVGQ